MIIIFGHTNDLTGALSAVMETRCKLALDLWNKNPQEQICCTGTFGSHFNKTDLPHFSYVHKRLIALGVPKANIGNGIYATNTYEDVLGIRKAFIDSSENKLNLITSDFHYKRVHFLCGRILQNIDYEIHQANTPEEIKVKLIDKEAKSWEVSQREIFFFPLYTKANTDIPKDIYDNAAQYHKHYDNLSLLAITGQMAVFGYGLKQLLDMSAKSDKLSLNLILVALAVGFFSFLLWKLYHRLAKSAWVARQLLRSLEVSYGQYGYSTLFTKQKFYVEYFGVIRIVNWLFWGQVIAISGILLLDLICPHWL